MRVLDHYNMHDPFSSSEVIIKMVARGNALQTAA